MDGTNDLGLIGDTSDWSVIGIGFTLHNLVPTRAMPGPGAPPAAREEVLMNIHTAGSRPVALFSVRTDDDGVLTQATSWRADSDSLAVFSGERCIIEDVPPPTDVSVVAIVEDAIGPVNDPRSEGFKEIAPGVFQRDEGPVDQRVSNWEDIGTRVVEMVGHDDGKVRTRIDGITVSETAFDLQGFAFPEECSNDVEAADVREMLMDR